MLPRNVANSLLSYRTAAHHAFLRNASNIPSRRELTLSHSNCQMSNWKSKHKYFIANQIFGQAFCSKLPSFSLSINPSGQKLSAEAQNKTMAKRVNLKGYDDFKATVTKIAGKEPIDIYFTGSKDDKGSSWCPDCVVAEPHVVAAVEKFTDNHGTVFMHVEVGDRAFWKDKKNPFRTDKEISLKVIPTLMQWGSHKRLEGPQCKKDDLLKLFFTDSEE